MRRFITLCKYQIWLMCISPSTYIAAFLFLCFMGLMYLISLYDISLTPSQQSPTEKFLSVFWVPVLFMVPLLTMRSLAEERRMGTLATLMTTPVTAWQIVFSKFLASYFFYSLLWVSTLLFPVVTQMYLPSVSADARLFDVHQMFSGYVFIFVSGAMYVAIGIFSSSLTRTTLVAGMLSFGMLFMSIVGAGLLASLPVTEGSGMEWILRPADYIQTFRHLEDFSSALFDTRPFFLYFSTAILLLALTTLVTEAKSA